jgi:hypothetical protein
VLERKGGDLVIADEWLTSRPEPTLLRRARGTNWPYGWDEGSKR